MLIGRLSAALEAFYCVKDDVFMSFVVSMKEKEQLLKTVERY